MQRLPAVATDGFMTGPFLLNQRQRICRQKKPSLGGNTVVVD
jgi:hypothetical protein